MTPFQQVKLTLMAAALQRSTVREVLYAAEEGQFDTLAADILSNRLAPKGEKEYDAFADLNA